MGRCLQSKNTLTPILILLLRESWTHSYHLHITDNTLRNLVPYTSLENIDMLMSKSWTYPCWGNSNLGKKIIAQRKDLPHVGRRGVWENGEWVPHFFMGWRDGSVLKCVCFCLPVSMSGVSQLPGAPVAGIWCCSSGLHSISMNVHIYTHRWTNASVKGNVLQKAYSADQSVHFQDFGSSAFNCIFYSLFVFSILWDLFYIWNTCQERLSKALKQENKVLLISLWLS